MTKQEKLDAIIAIEAALAKLKEAVEAELDA